VQASCGATAANVWNSPFFRTWNSIVVSIVQSLAVAVSLVRPGSVNVFGFAARDRDLGSTDTLGVGVGDAAGAGLVACQVPEPEAPPLQVALHVPFAMASFDDWSDNCPSLA
jgi:hypothetical protein